MAPPRQSTSLETFVTNTFFFLVIQDDDEVFKITYNRNFDRGYEAIFNSDRLNFQTHLDFVQTLRKSVSDRRLVRFEAVVNETNENGVTCQVGFISEVGGNKDGKEVVYKSVGTLNVVFLEKHREGGGGHRQIDGERLVMRVEEKGEAESA
ncbi:hypothetical protein K469DRAFT_693076 [Zopfia rhizophila CBS 207.26]|uniref:SnoaL-like domain-containing protein n=1 Tax=Zopfia rhizophila CBS 207.26 TaxID=1314779 RepID=A0A6A6ELF1_9PEZI|nr:hypothetical protein K469DRAFT_693076 [Zopfia rhizophila CBS 207.26]